MRGETLRWPVLTGCLLCAFSVLAASPGAKKTKYAVTAIAPVPDAACEPGFQRFVYARRINESGVVIGHEDCFAATGDPEAPYLPRGANALRWSAATGAEMLPTLNGQRSDTYARGVNDLGDAVGRDFPPAGTSLALFWPAGGGVSDVFSASPCSFALPMAEGINNRGSIAGSDSRPNEFGGCSQQWVLKLATGEEIVGPNGLVFDINDNDVLVGEAGSDIIRWSAEAGAVTLHQGSGGLVGVQAWSINERNEVVGSVLEYDGATGCTTGKDARFWAADGSEHTLPLLPNAVAGNAFGVNNHGQIVGDVQLAFDCDVDPALSRAVLWNRGKVVDLNTRVPKKFARDYQLTFATGVNDRGQITVRAIRRDEPQVRCPIWDFDFESGENFYNDARTCRNEYAFLLTPRHGGGDDR